MTAEPTRESPEVLPREARYVLAGDVLTDPRGRNRRTVLQVGMRHADWKVAIRTHAGTSFHNPGDWVWCTVADGAAWIDG